MIRSKEDLIVKVYEQMEEAEIIDFINYPDEVSAKKVIADILETELKEFVLIAKTDIIE